MPTSSFPLATPASGDVQRGRSPQEARLSGGKEARGEAAMSLTKKRQSGRWGVAQPCNYRSILDAIASLLEAHRPDLAMVLIEQELNPQY
jgi:acyl-CoA reductase-like NAD-dependent aldehyde dehydrogenase